mgnify:CR=1 FL=1
MAALGGKAAGEFQKWQVIVQKCDSRNTGIHSGCRPSGRAGARACVKQGLGRKLWAPSGKLGHAERHCRIGGRQPRDEIGAKIQCAVGAPALPVAFGHAGGFIHQGPRGIFGEIPVNCRFQLGRNGIHGWAKSRWLTRFTAQSRVAWLGEQVRLNLYPSYRYKWN